MAASSDLKQQQTFACSSCDFVVDFHYKGRRPPFSRHILLHEDCFVMKDPFSQSGGFITVGASCFKCQEPICMSNDCSLYYTKRFCLPCAESHLQEFPLELQHEICNKRNK